jgi:hypothetical protein
MSIIRHTLERLCDSILTNWRDCSGGRRLVSMLIMGRTLWLEVGQRRLEDVVAAIAIIDGDRPHRLDVALYFDPLLPVHRYHDAEHGRSP